MVEDSPYKNEEPEDENSDDYPENDNGWDDYQVCYYFLKVRKVYILPTTHYFLYG